MYSKAPTAPITGEPKKPPKAPAIELYTSKGRSSLPSLSRSAIKLPTPPLRKTSGPSGPTAAPLHNAINA